MDCIRKIRVEREGACHQTWGTCGGMAERKALIGTSISTFGPMARKLG